MYYVLMQFAFDFPAASATFTPDHLQVFTKPIKSLIALLQCARYNPRMKISFGLLMMLLVIGCGGSTNSSTGCSLSAITVSPQSATVDHLAATPANSQVFLAFAQASQPSGCVFTTGAIQNAAWTVSDPVNASISNSHDQLNANYGRATCINATPAPITVTAVAPSGNGSTINGTATLTCN